LAGLTGLTGVAGVAGPNGVTGATGATGATGVNDLQQQRSSAVRAEPAASSGARWLSGASGERVADGGFDHWRGSPAGIAGTWADSDPASQREVYAICGGDYSRWNRPLDLAVGGIFRSQGDSWAAAARGSYDARWRTLLTRIKQCWGSRDPGLLYLRFAHEMNLPGDWQVRGGEEAAFRTAITRFSTLRYQIVPRAKIVLCPNDGTDGDLGGLDIRKLWPGKDSHGRRVVDVYAVDSYNNWPHVTTHSGFVAKINSRYSSGIPLGIESHRQLAARFGVPFAVPEWSNNGDPAAGGGGGEAVLFVRDFRNWAAAHAGNPARPAAGQLLYEIQFDLWRQYQFWPTTMQPLTASAYRSLRWGH
jgi:hypothetical protein